MKTSELTGAALDWAVAKCEGRTWVHAENFLAYYEDGDEGEMHYSTNWAQGGPIIEREKISLSPLHLDPWRSNVINDDLKSFWEDGPTPLIAAMRCYVASKLGDTVEIPEELQ
jgi:hypothetical protein